MDITPYFIIAVAFYALGIYVGRNWDKFTSEE